MAVPKQFVEVEFRPGGQRYTYDYSGPALFVGDRVRVEARGGGWSAVTVVNILDRQPTFATKSVLGRAEEAPEPEEPKPGADDLFGDEA